MTKAKDRISAPLFLFSLSQFTETSAQMQIKHISSFKFEQMGCKINDSTCILFMLTKKLFPTLKSTVQQVARTINNINVAITSKGAEMKSSFHFAFILKRENEECILSEVLKTDLKAKKFRKEIYNMCSLTSLSVRKC